MHPLTAFILTLTVLCLQTAAKPDWPKVYATSANGSEVINLNAEGISLAYVSNLMLNTFPSQEKIYTLYFLADKGTPNIFTAQFIAEDTNFAFWSTGHSDLSAEETMPFFSFDIYHNNIIGPAFPNNNTEVLASKFAIQSVFINPEPAVRQEGTESLLFVSTLIDPQPRSGVTYVYFAGWANSGTNPFVVARATINLDSISPDVTLDPIQGVLGIPMPIRCYDQFTPTSRPTMKISSVNNVNYLLLVVPGRCGFFASIPLPTEPNVIWQSIPLDSINTYSPIQDITNYISSAVISTKDNTIYFARKSHDQHGAYLFSFDSSRWTPNSATASVDDIGESEAILVYGENTPNDYLFLLAAGSNKIKRYTIGEKNTFVVDAFAALIPTLSQVSSALYLNPHLYFTTYEPDAKLVRVPMNNFCSSFCGDNGYCSKGSCQCVDGYTKDPSSSTFGCVLNSIVSLEDKEKSNQGATAALGVFLGFSLLAAIAGWGMWWKERKNTYVAVKS